MGCNPIANGVEMLIGNKPEGKNEAVTLRNTLNIVSST
jgi:hypothetical protein